MTGRGTYCHGLVDKVVISQHLDSTKLEVFSNLIESVILQCSPSEQISTLYMTQTTNHIQGLFSQEICLKILPFSFISKKTM